jgi:hypothetical protein
MIWAYVKLREVVSRIYLSRTYSLELINSIFSFLTNECTFIFVFCSIRCLKLKINVKMQGEHNVKFINSILPSFMSSVWTIVKTNTPTLSLNRKDGTDTLS